MARATTFPYRMAGSGNAEVDEWYLVQQEDELMPLPESLAAWDSETDIEVGADVLVDRAAVSRNTHLGERPLRLGLSWYCRTTQLRGTGSTVILSEHGEIQRYRLRCTAPGRDLGGKVCFRVTVTLAGDREESDPLVARIPGSIAWEDSREVTIEGNAGRFPIQWIDFESAGTLPDGAAWWLDWDPENLEDSVGRGVRLLLNSKHEQLQQALADPESPVANAVFEAIHFDLGKTLITGALENEDFVQSATEYPDSTIGVEIKRLIDALFPDVDLKYLRTRSQRERFRFDVELQHALRLFGGLKIQ